MTLSEFKYSNAFINEYRPRANRNFRDEIKAHFTHAPIRRYGINQTTLLVFMRFDTISYITQNTNKKRPPAADTKTLNLLSNRELKR